MAIDTLIDQSEPETIQPDNQSVVDYDQTQYDWEEGLGIDELNNVKLIGSVLAALIHYRYKENRDLKILVTSKGSSTGLGKTTLAIVLCYFADIHGWTAEEKGFVNIHDYMKTYKNCKPFSALLIDELEHSADNRRAMSNTNVDLTHAWAQLRYRNVVSIGTLPTTSMIDGRLLELSDIWINVIDKGKAIAWYLTVNDISGEIKRYQLRNPYNAEVEIYKWPQLQNEDYKIMQQRKDDSVRIGKDAQVYDNEEVEQREKQAVKDFRNDIIQELYEFDEVNISQRQIGDLPSIDLTQQTVSQILHS